MDFWFFGDTNTGLKRKNNQDATLYLSGISEGHSIGLAIVSDGMGGLSKGEVASALVIDSFKAWWHDIMPIYLAKKNTIRNISDSLDDEITAINETIVDYANANNIRIGTTLSLAFIYDCQIIIKNIGDSRGYVLSPDGLKQFTVDDSYQQQFRDAGYSEEEIKAKNIKQNILTKCLGQDSLIKADTQILSFKEDVLLCTDGVYQYISEQTLIDALSKMNEENEVVQKRRIQDEIELNGAKDNWTYILIKKLGDGLVYEY